MSTPGGGGPGGNKWVAVNITGLSGQQAADALSRAASVGFYKTPIVVQAFDGYFVLVSNYED